MSVRQRTRKLEQGPHYGHREYPKIHKHQKHGLLPSCKTLAIGLLLVPVAVVAAISLFLTAPFEAQYVSFPDPPEFVGPLEPNNKLENTEILYKDHLLGPESIATQGEHIYTGTADGRIEHIYRGEINTVVQLGNPPCGGYANEHTCGRPLGMRFDEDGYLVVLDAYLGLFKVNVATGDKFLVFPSTRKIGGKSSKFLNDLDIASDGTIYISDSSTTFTRREFPYIFLSSKGDGRLIKYDPVSDKAEVLLDHLSFANGVQLSRKEEYVLVTLTTTAKIIKYHLKGPKSGTSEVFADNLPGTPDNIRLSSSGGYWVGFASCRRAGKFSLIDFMSTKPWLRSFMGKILSPAIMMKLMIPCAIAVELNENGEIVQSLQDLNGTRIKGVSEIEDDAGLLYLGSFNAPFLGRLNTRKRN